MKERKKQFEEYLFKLENDDHIRLELVLNGVSCIDLRENIDITKKFVIELLNEANKKAAHADLKLTVIEKILDEKL